MNTKPETSRPVARVLVMLDYGNGTDEVFDITALTNELFAKSKDGHAKIELKVTTRNDYSANRDPATGKYPPKTEACWDVMVNFRSSGDAGFLDDAINASMPDSFTTENLRRKLKAIEKKQAQLQEDIALQRLRDAAAVRAQHPIARVQIEAKRLPPAA
jgi:hypothetical protein